MEQPGKMGVRVEVAASVFRRRPARMLQEHLSAELVGDAERLERSETPDPLAPVGILGFARGAPIPRDELANPSCDHDSIVARRLALLQPYKSGWKQRVGCLARRSEGTFQARALSPSETVPGTCLKKLRRGHLSGQAARWVVPC